jgi:hypothetical protein
MNDKTAKSKLYNFCTSQIGQKPVKTKSGKGYMLYSPKAIEQVQHLTELVEQVNGWTVRVFDEEWDKGKKIKNASVYFGQTTDNGVDEDEFLNS